MNIKYYWFRTSDGKVHYTFNKPTFNTGLLGALSDDDFHLSFRDIANWDELPKVLTGTPKINLK